MAGKNTAAFGLYSEFREDSKHYAFETTHIGDNVDGIGKPHDGIPDELPRTVPGDLAAAVDVDDGRAVDRAFRGFGTPPGGVDARMFE